MITLIAGLAVSFTTESMQYLFKIGLFEFDDLFHNGLGIVIGFLLHLVFGRIFDFDWNHYNAGQVVYQPKNMSPEKLQDLYDYAWKSFYANESQEQKMFRLFCNVAMREMEDGTFRPRDRKLANKSFGRDVDRSKSHFNEF